MCFSVVRCFGEYEDVLQRLGTETGEELQILQQTANVIDNFINVIDNIVASGIPA